MTAGMAAEQDPTDRILDRLESAGQVRRAGAGWSAHCPAHDDRTASLEVKRADSGKASVK